MIDRNQILVRIITPDEYTVLKQRVLARERGIEEAGKDQDLAERVESLGERYDREKWGTNAYGEIVQPFMAKSYENLILQFLDTPEATRISTRNFYARGLEGIWKKAVKYDFYPQGMDAAPDTNLVDRFAGTARKNGFMYVKFSHKEIVLTRQSDSWRFDNEIGFREDGNGAYSSNIKVPVSTVNRYRVEGLCQPTPEQLMFYALAMPRV